MTIDNERAEQFRQDSIELNQALRNESAKLQRIRKRVKDADYRNTMSDRDTYNPKYDNLISDLLEILNDQPTCRNID